MEKFRKRSLKRSLPSACNFHENPHIAQPPPIPNPAMINNLCGLHVFMSWIPSGQNISLESLQKDARKEGFAHA